MRLLTFSFLKSFKIKTACCRQLAIMSGSDPESEVVLPKTGDPNLIDIAPSWKNNEEVELRSALASDMQVYPDFITEREEMALLAELEPQLKRMRYEFDHWDNAIHGYRETERSQWRSENESVLWRVRAQAFKLGGAPLPHAHVLDLAAAGHIKPHIDAVRFCGDVIAGLCLLSSAVMRLEHDQKKHLVLDALLARRSLYIMRGVVRYSFTHAVLGGEHSVWRQEKLPRKRRVAVILRSKPHPSDQGPQPAK